MERISLKKKKKKNRKEASLFPCVRIEIGLLIVCCSGIKYNCSRSKGSRRRYALVRRNELVVCRLWHRRMSRNHTGGKLMTVNLFLRLILICGTFNIFMIVDVIIYIMSASCHGTWMWMRFHFRNVFRKWIQWKSYENLRKHMCRNWFDPKNNKKETLKNEKYCNQICI